MPRDWVEWHERYDRPGSSLHRRLVLVQHRVREALDAQPPGPIRILSMCAGQGRDLLGVLADHPRRDDVRARLVELDPDNAALARAAAPPGVVVITGDASTTTAYEDIAPVRIAMVCGVFGNIGDDDIRHTVEQLPRLCLPGATVIWTRHREAPDVTPSIRRWFAENGFSEHAFDSADGYAFGVGTHRLTGEALPFERNVRLFRFVGFD